MTNKITILGSGSCNLTPDRMAASVLIQKDGRNIVYDFGRGASIRLTEVGLRQADITTIILSHLHPDHVTDLYPFLHAASWSQIDPRVNNLTIYGQPGTKEFVTTKLLTVFDDQQLSRNFSINTIDIQPSLIEIEGLKIQFIDLHHSYGMKFEENGKQYAIMGDSSFHTDLVDALSMVDLGVFDAGHLTDEEVVELAVQSNAELLVCSHLYRELDENTLNNAARAQGYTGQIVVAHDRREFAF